jgi:hypothetical protein
MADDDMKIKVRSIFGLVTTLKEANLDGAFIEEMEKRKISVTVSMDAINAAKQFFVSHGLHEKTEFGQTIGITMDAAPQRADPGCQGGHCGHTAEF